jgi:hypothetical protein
VYVGAAGYINELELLKGNSKAMSKDMREYFICV